MYEKQFEFLKKAVELNRLPHALLFFGQAGIGKKDFAVKFVSSILKENPGHPDFVLLDPQKEIAIAEIRNLMEKLSFKPYSAGQKFAVINKAHLMNQEAQNCFLKFLEEPKDKTFLILITEYPNLLLPTILSRVQKIRFYPEKGFKVKENEEALLELSRALKEDLAFKFNLSKNLAEQEIDPILDSWLRYFRQVLLEGIKKKDKSLAKTSEIIKEIQKTKNLLATTNINTRLALEILLMKI